MQNESRPRRDVIAIVALLVSFLTFLLGDNLYERFSGRSLLSLLSRDEVTVTSIRFFEHGEKDIPQNQRAYQTFFYKDTVRFISWEITLQHPAPRERIASTLHVVYLREDNTILEEFDYSFSILPEWTGSVQSAHIGQSEPGSWDTGRYTVVFYIGNYEIGRESFTIGSLLDNLSVTAIKFYESGFEGTPYGQRIYEQRLYRDTARYIYSEINFQYPMPGQRIDFTLHMVYLRSDGTVFRERDCESYLQPYWIQSYQSCPIGWSEPGSWESDTYTVVFYLDDHEIGRGSFIVGDLRSNLSLNAIRFFESGSEIAPLDQRVYANEFYRDLVRFIVSEIHFKYPVPGQRIDFTLHMVYLRSDGTVFRERDCQSYIDSSWSGSFHACGVGSSEQGSWESDTYTVVIYLHGFEIGRGSFMME